ncbi:HCCA isomerase/glutathione S-transferase kappa [Coniochaeta sp. PMI_546]|nr:HCCA isomerase/glutathione S-transferase kappa [Coniochaeta sp. PMI_546]
MPSPKITLFVDIVSPFAYEAYHILRNDPTFKKCEITYVPIFLGGLMKTCNNTAPILIKNKDTWINTERLRWARVFSVPICDKLPPNFPPLTLQPMRALCTIQCHDGQSQERLLEVLDALFHQYWVNQIPSHEPGPLKRLLTDVLGTQEAEKVLSDAATLGKARLVENTDRAFAEGAFGLPWMTCVNTQGETEGFWGVDHLGQVAQFLGLERPNHGGWKSVL